MSIYNKTNKSVADIVANIMSEKLHPNQQKLDVHEPEKDKLTAADFKKLRAKKEVKEETEKLNEDHFKVGDEVVCKASGMEGEVIKVDPKGEGKYYTVKREDGKTMQYAPEELKLDDDEEDDEDEKEMKESSEQLREYQSKGGVYKHQGTYGRAKGAEHGDTDYEKENEMAKTADKPKKPNRAKYGARQNFNRSTRVNESFSEMLAVYKQGGIKSLMEATKAEELDEEVDSDTFNNEMKDQKAKFDGKKKGADIAKASVQAVKNEDVDLDEEQLDELSVNKMLTYRSKATEKLGSDPAKDAKRKEGIRVSGVKVKEKLGLKKEEKDLPFDPPYKKAEDEKKTDKSGAVHTPMSRARDLARQALKKQVKEEYNLNITDEQADDIIQERELSASESDKKEKYVKSMKKNLSGFKDRYGDRAKEVLYATATRMAKED